MNPSLESRMERLETKVDERFNSISKQISDNHQTNIEQHKEIRDLIKAIELQKADKWVETTLSRLNWVVILSVFGGLLALVIKTS